MENYLYRSERLIHCLHACNDSEVKNIASVLHCFPDILKGDIYALYDLLTDYKNKDDITGKLFFTSSKKIIFGFCLLALDRLSMQQTIHCRHFGDFYEELLFCVHHVVLHNTFKDAIVRGSSFYNDWFDRLESDQNDIDNKV